MEIITLDKENIAVYHNWYTQDTAENIGRMGYYGIAQKQGEGALFWRQSKVNASGEILSFAARDSETAKALLTEYEDRLRYEGITRSELELSLELGAAEQDALREKGYALHEEEGKVLRTTISHLASLPFVARCDLPQTVGSTGALTIRQFQQGIFNGRKAVTIEDAQKLPMSWFDQALSACVQIEGRVRGYLLVHRLPSGAYRPEVFYITEPAVTQNLLDMIRYVIFRVQDELSGDTQIIIPRSSETIRALTDKLLPGLKGDTVLAASKELSGKGE